MADKKHNDAALVVKIEAAQDMAELVTALAGASAEARNRLVRQITEAVERITEAQAQTE